MDKNINIKSSNSGINTELTPEIVKKIAEVDPLAIIGSHNKESDNLQNDDLESAPIQKRLLARFIDNFLYIAIFTGVSVIGSVLLFLKYNNSGETYTKLLACSSTYSTPEQLANLGADVVCRNYLNDFNTLSLIVYTVSGVISIAYYVIMTKTRGATLGKTWSKIRVVGDTMLNITWIQSIGREFFWILFTIAIVISNFNIDIGSAITTFLFSLIILDSLNIFFNKNNSTLHDRISQTRVVKK